MSDRQLERISDVDFPDGEDGRLYYDPSNPPPNGPLYPSVTTVLNRREDEQKERALNNWRQKNDGEDGRPDHNHLFWYSGPRGTVIHWYILSHLMGDEDLAGEEEEEAIQKIENRATEWGFVNSVAKNHDGVLHFPDEETYNAALEDDEKTPTTLTDILWEDSSWALEAFCNLLPRTGLADQSFEESPARTIKSYIARDVRTENVIDIEVFTHHEGYRYAGQYDLLYERPSGEVVLCDLKTTSGVYWKHRRQLEAYARTLDREIDELEVIRLQPDRRETQISRFSRWGNTRDELWSDFCLLHAKVDEMIDELRETVDWDEVLENGDSYHEIR